MQPIASVQGIMLANIVLNAAEAAGTGIVKLATRITFDDGTTFGGAARCRRPPFAD